MYGIDMKAMEMNRGRMDVSLDEFYDMLRFHDWYYEFSDDHQVWKKGKQARAVLKSAAEAGGPAYQKLYEGFAEHMFSGEPWGTERKPQPSPPHEKE